MYDIELAIYLSFVRSSVESDKKQKSCKNLHLYHFSFFIFPLSDWYSMYKHGSLLKRLKYTNDINYRIKEKSKSCSYHCKLHFLFKENWFSTSSQSLYKILHFYVRFGWKNNNLISLFWLFLLLDSRVQERAVRVWGQIPRKQARLI